MRPTNDRNQCCNYDGGRPPAGIVQARPANRPTVLPGCPGGNECKREKVLLKGLSKNRKDDPPGGGEPSMRFCETRFKFGLRESNL